MDDSTMPTGENPDINVPKKSKKNILFIIIAAAIVLLCIGFLLIRYINTPIPKEHMPNEIGVTFIQGVTPLEAKEIAESSGGIILEINQIGLGTRDKIREVNYNYYPWSIWKGDSSNRVVVVYDGASDQKLLEKIELIEKNENVEFAEPNYLMRRQGMVAD